MRSARVAALAGALACALAIPGSGGAHPGHGPPTVSIENFAYTPDRQIISEGDPVIWFWDGSGLDTRHSVTADAGQAEQFDSDPSTPASEVAHDQGDSFSHVFEQPGTYSYHCKVHDFMRGEIVVREVAGNGNGGGDRTSPRVLGARAIPRLFCTARSRSCERAGTALYWGVSEDSSTNLLFYRRSGGSWARIGRIARTSPRGVNGIDIRAPLPPGIYGVRFVAVDAAGNISDPLGYLFGVRS